MTPEVHWLVMLSRARTLDGILLLHNAAKADLERGPPQYLVHEIDRLVQLEAQCDYVVVSVITLTRQTPWKRGHGCAQGCGATET